MMQPAGPTEKIVAEEGAQLDFSKDMSYGDYLHLDEILNAQHPLSPSHNEMLFIVQHQTSELWMKLLLHELSAVIRCVAADDLGSAFKMLARVSKIMEQLVHAWDVLATMTPPEYSAIRPYLSAKQRLPERAIPLHRVHARQQERRDAEAARAPARPARAGRRGVARALRCTTKRCACSRAAASMCRLRTPSATGRSPTSRTTRRAGLADRLPRPEGALGSVPARRRTHRPRRRVPALALSPRDHGRTHHRLQARTGGTSGVGYLRKMLDVVLFPEIWKLRTDL